ncbi:MAG TPA: hypothetical protein VKR82_01455 [Candidatus Acidoferrales bacterium]|nr:hypothetical protein [Candidatus Acidoferrales bacterium]
MALLLTPSLRRSALVQAQSATKSSPAKRSGGQRLELAPTYEPGQVLRYQLETTITNQANRGGAIRDPQAPGKLTLNWSAITRMEVLSMGNDAPGKPNGGVRLRSTYEKSAATATSDTFDPEALSLEEQYRELEGKAFEFTLDAAGKVTDIKSLEGIGEKDRTADALRVWFKQISNVSGVPPGGVEVGQTWATQQPVTSAPLAGLTWEGRSTYTRNEPCQPANKAGDANFMAGEMCAVVLCKLTLTGLKPGHDTTPDSYRKLGLRTAGTWSGEGESLSYISLRTGRLVSVTQTSNEEMNYTVTTDAGQNRVSYQGSVRSHSELALLSSTQSATKN